MTPTAAITSAARAAPRTSGRRTAPTTIIAVLAASAMPSVDGEIPAASDAVRAQSRLELSVAGEEQHEPEHAQLHHAPGAPSASAARVARPPGTPSPPGTARAASVRSARWRRPGTSRPRCRTAAGSCPALFSSTIWPPMSATDAEAQGSAGRTAWRRTASASSGVEHHTIIVASAGCSTAGCPHPAPPRRLTPSAHCSRAPARPHPTEATTEAATSTGSGPRRSMARPVKGRTTSAAMAKAASTMPRRTGHQDLGPPPRTRRVNGTVNPDVRTRSARCPPRTGASPRPSPWSLSPAFAVRGSRLKTSNLKL